MNIESTTITRQSQHIQMMAAIFQANLSWVIMHVWTCHKIEQFSYVISKLLFFLELGEIILSGQRAVVSLSLFYCSSTICAFRPNTSTYHLNHLLLCLPSLRQADQVIRRYWTGIHREGKVPMNKLFVEMLEAYFR
jgi:hypothetical protein